MDLPNDDMHEYLMLCPPPAPGKRWQQNNNDKGSSSIKKIRKGGGGSLIHYFFSPNLLVPKNLGNGQCTLEILIKDHQYSYSSAYFQRKFNFLSSFYCIFPIIATKRRNLTTTENSQNALKWILISTNVPFLPILCGGGGSSQPFHIMSIYFCLWRNLDNGQFNFISCASVAQRVLPRYELFCGMWCM